MLLLAGDGGTHVQAALPERRPARQGRRRPGRRPPRSARSREIELTDDNQAADQDRGRGALRAAARGHDGDRSARPRCRASPTATSRSRPGPNSDAKLPTTARRSATDKTTTSVDLDQLFNTLDPKTRKGLQDVIQGFATQYDGQGRAGQPGRQVLQPALSTLARLVNEVTADQGALDALPRQLLARGDRARRAPRRPRRPRHATPTRRPARSRAENRALDAGARRCCRRRCGAANTTFVNLRATLDDLDVLVARPSRRTKDLAPFLRELRPLVHDARPTIHDLRTLVRRPGAEQRPHRPAAARRRRSQQRRQARRSRTRSTALQQGQPVLEFIRPVHARARRLAPRLRPGRRPTTTPTATTRASSRSSTPSSSPTTRPAACSTPIPPRQRLDGLQTGDRQALPGRRQPAAARTARRRSATRTAPSTATRAIVLARPMRRVARHRRSSSLAAAALVVFGTGASDDGGGYKVRAIFDNAVLRDPRRGREDRRRQGRQDRVARRHARQQGRGRAATSRARLPGLPHRRRAARSARSR